MHSLPSPPLNHTTCRPLPKQLHTSARRSVRHGLLCRLPSRRLLGTSLLRHFLLTRAAREGGWREGERVGPAPHDRPTPPRRCATLRRRRRASARCTHRRTTLSCRRWRREKRRCTRRCRWHVPTMCERRILRSPLLTATTSCSPPHRSRGQTSLEWVPRRAALISLNHSSRLHIRGAQTDSRLRRYRPRPRQWTATFGPPPRRRWRHSRHPTCTATRTQQQ